jgi:nitrate/TMAO reductase-like tetraheme cytochrome c subunit
MLTPALSLRYGGAMASSPSYRWHDEETRKGEVQKTQRNTDPLVQNNFSGVSQAPWHRRTTSRHEMEKSNSPECRNCHNSVVHSLPAS